MAECPGPAEAGHYDVKYAGHYDLTYVVSGCSRTFGGTL